MDLKLELILLPVTDVDRAKAFYRDNVGFAVHVDHQASDAFRVVQMDPPGSSCSISFGVGITDAAAGQRAWPAPGGQRHRGRAARRWSSGASTSARSGT